MNFKQLIHLVGTQNKDFLESNQLVALGMSGGVDSTALFHVFCELRKIKKIKNFIVLHVNFGLRGDESEGDLGFCQALAKKHNVEFHSRICAAEKKRTAKQRGESTQVWARRIRHEWFHEFHMRGFQIALAHNANDVAENVLFRMSRGSLPENLAGMSRSDGPIWRPFVSILRSDIEQAMVGAKLHWREDSSNSSTKYTRNRIRHDVLKTLEELAPGAAERIAELGMNLALREVDRPHLGAILSSKNLSRQKVQIVGDFLKAAEEGQSIDLGDGFVLSKRALKPSEQDKPLDLALQTNARALQHAHGLDLDQVTAVVTGGSKLFVPKPAIFSEFGMRPLMQIQIDDKNTQESAEIMVRAPKSEDKVTFAGLRTPFKFKELMQKWKIGVLDRLRFVLMTTTRSKEAYLVKLFEK